MSFEDWYKEYVEGTKNWGESEGNDTKPDNPNYLETIDINDIDKKLSKYENSIIEQDFESCYVIRPDGSVYLFDGEKFNVNPEGVSFDGAIVLHNHPPDRYGCTDSFSRDDLDFIKLHPKAKEYLVVGGDYEYSLKVAKEIDMIWTDIYSGGMELALKHPEEDSPHHFIMEYLKQEGYIEYERKRIK